jgi:exonuclease SbcD
MSFRIGFFADSHLGYRAAKVASNERGINIRVQDGYDAFRETLNQMLSSDPKLDAIIHGGDLFHKSQPTPRDIAIAQHYLREIARRGIPFYGIAGNHDASDIRSEMPAVAPVHDPDRKIFALYEPYKTYNLNEQIVLHSVSHHGLDDAPKVEAIEGKYNIFTTHGMALDPKNSKLLQAADSPREQKIPVELILDENFILRLLGHYHSRYPVGSKALNTWYSGSSIRRGFSDEPGERGWLLIEIDDNGHITVAPRNISQRPQFDLEPIDAMDLTASDVMNLLEINMGRTKDVNQEPIVRQRIVNASRGIKEGLDRDKIRELSKHMLSWQLEFPKMEQVASASRKEDISLAGRHMINVLDQYAAWRKAEIESVPEEFRDAVDKDIRDYLTRAKEAGA